MLADSIDGGIFAILVLIGAVGVSLIALMALIPATQANRLLTFVFVSPALIAVLAVTIWLGYGFFTDGLKDPDMAIMDFIGAWVIFAGLPAVTSGTALLVLWVKRRKQRQQQATEQSL